MVYISGFTDLFFEHQVAYINIAADSSTTKHPALSISFKHMGVNKGTVTKCEIFKKYPLGWANISEPMVYSQYIMSGYKWYGNNF